MHSETLLNKLHDIIIIHIKKKLNLDNNIKESEDHLILLFCWVCLYLCLGSPSV